MTNVEALGILGDALRRCGTEDMRTPEVAAALAQLEPHAAEAWPFDQFRRALEIRGEVGAAETSRVQTVNASLNAIRRVVRTDRSTR